MDIDLTLLHSKTVDEIDISGIYNIPDEYIDQDLIHSIDKVNVEGRVYNDNELDKIECSIKGKMYIEDSISLELIEYPFSIEYSDILEENVKKDEKTLDIFSFLWENIVLEVPLHLTEVEDFSKFQGEGWKLVSEEELTNSNNPFSDLLKDYKEE